MALPKETLWNLEPHTAAKHEILRRYLGAWFPILGKNNRRIVYIDGFSGPGRYANGELGSPIIALNVAASYDKVVTREMVFWFIEERQDRLAHLKRELAQLDLPSHFDVFADAGQFHELFGNVLASIEAGENALAPTFAFIDPFGISGIPFSVIERLLAHKRSEVLITFMVDAINRFLEHPDDSVVRHIVDALGGDEAVEIAKGSGDRIKKLRELYQTKLSTVAKYVRFFEMRGRNNRTQYYLFFATNHELGHVKMKESMWKVDPDGEFRFSDATDPNQRVLFEVDAAEKLAAKIRREFAGAGTVTGRQVLTFVENRTAFVKKHMTAALKLEEASGRLSVDVLKSNGQKRRASTFPDEAKLTWA